MYESTNQFQGYIKKEQYDFINKYMGLIDDYDYEPYDAFRIPRPNMKLLVRMLQRFTSDVTNCDVLVIRS